MEKKDALQLLQPFTGTWNTSGRVLAGRDGVYAEIKGTDTYQWLPGGFFMLHTVDVWMGEEHSQSLEVIGYDEHAQLFTMHAFDHKGVETVMNAEHKDGRWIFRNAALRFEGSFKEHDRLITGRWMQKDEQGEWQQFIDIRLLKS